MKRWMNVATMSALVLALAACNQGGDKLTQLPASEAALEAAAVQVETVNVVRQELVRAVNATGTTEPVREANLGPQMTARVAQILVQEGSKVKAGQPLVQLDGVEASLRVQSTAANSASTQTQYELAKAEYERLAPLAEKGTVTPQQLQRLASQRDALRAASDAARVAEEDAKRNVNNTSVRAPLPGVISKVNVDVGEVATMMPVTVLLRLVDLSSVDVRVKVHERELSRIAIGDSVQAKFPSSGQTAQGLVTFISPEIDPRTRNAEIVTRIPNADFALRAGMFAEIDIQPKGAQQSLIIPTTAVGGAGDNRFVYVAAGDKVERRKVRVAPIDGERVEVLEGLKEGEPVVKEGLGRLSDGAKIALGGATQAPAPKTAEASASGAKP
jgi:RND family efflux transporter MFP subunit